MQRCITLPVGQGRSAGSGCTLASANTGIESPMFLGAYGYPYPSTHVESLGFPCSLYNHDHNALSMFFGQCWCIQPTYFPSTDAAIGFEESRDHFNPYEYMGCNSDRSDSDSCYSSDSNSSSPTDTPVLQKSVPIYTVPLTTAQRKHNSRQSRKRNPLLSKEDRDIIKGKLVVMRDQKIPWKKIASIINEEFGGKLDSEDGFKVPCLEMMHLRNKKRIRGPLRVRYLLILCSCKCHWTQADVLSMVRSAAGSRWREAGYSIPGHTPGVYLSCELWWFIESTVPVTPSISFLPLFLFFFLFYLFLVFYLLLLSTYGWIILCIPSGFLFPPPYFIHFRLDPWWFFFHFFFFSFFTFLYSRHFSLKFVLSTYSIGEFRIFLFLLPILHILLINISWSITLLKNVDALRLIYRSKAIYINGNCGICMST